MNFCIHSHGGTQSKMSIKRLLLRRWMSLCPRARKTRASSIFSWSAMDEFLAVVAIHSTIRWSKGHLHFTRALCVVLICWGTQTLCLVFIYLNYSWGLQDLHKDYVTSMMELTNDIPKCLPATSGACDCVTFVGRTKWVIGNGGYSALSRHTNVKASAAIVERQEGKGQERLCDSRCRGWNER